MSASRTLPSVSEIIEKTAFKTEKRAEAARATLEWLEAGAPHKFDGLPGEFSFDMGEFYSPRACGTVCCIAGAIYSYEYAKSRTLGNHGLAGLFQVARNPDLEKLFYAGAADVDDVPGDWPFLTDIHASQAAVVLRHYLTTGVVDWSLNAEAASC